MAFLVAASLSASPAPLNVVTFGTGITSQSGWQQPVARAMEQCLDRPVAIASLGGSGQGSEWALANVAQVNALKPDVVIVEFAMGDANIFNWTSPQASRRNTVELIARLQDGPSHPRVMLMTTNPVTGWRRMLHPRLNAYYKDYRRISQARRVPLIDGAVGWRRLPMAVRDDALPDGVHPRPRVFAKAVIPSLMRVAGCKG